MASTSVTGEVQNKQLWDEALTRLLDLSTVTIKRSVDLEARVAELELELSVWKQAHSNVVDMVERDKKAHNVQVATLNKQLSSLETIKNPFILCAIDANTNVFNQALWAQGHQGGRHAAQKLTQGIAEYLSQEDVQVFGRLSFWIIMFVDRERLLATLLGSNICTVEQFKSFFVGFSESSPRFLVVETGPGQNAVDAKLKEYIETYTRYPQTLRLILGGGYDSEYLATFNSLNEEELMGKLALLKGPNDPADDIQQLALPVIAVEDLFELHKLPSADKRPGPISLPPPGMGSITTNGGLISPQSESHFSRASDPSKTTRNLKLIDATKPLHKQSPPPCNEHYLMTCSKGSTCKYSHEWDLTPEQLDTLAKNAKKAPCNYLKNGLGCPYGDRCCWGHVCPSGSRCFHLSKGKCWFKGATMHPPVGQDDSVCSG
ncbi:unnamed protein product [Somion occarium]|uniref:C3H1-type domain-containing protein n=1 Tax=Somion occarium TaxID=3059160 RepID=A0ABP1D3B5_9APHY